MFKEIPFPHSGVGTVERAQCVGVCLRRTRLHRQQSCGSCARGQIQGGSWGAADPRQLEKNVISTADTISLTKLSSLPVSITAMKDKAYSPQRL